MIALTPALTLPARIPLGTGAAEKDDLQARLAGLAAENAALREKLEAQDRFIKTAVHDLNNPLTMIDGHLQILLMEKDNLTPRQKADAEKALNGTRRLGGLIRAILDFARSGASEAALKRSPLDLAALLRETADGMSARAAERRVAIELNLPASGAVVSADADLMRRLVENLVSNGIKYNKEGGRLALGLRQAEGGWELSFADEGIGIAAEDLPKLFGPFFRADNVRGKIAGNGLGLASARNIAQRHGGRIEVDSVPGRGTTFRVFIPQNL
jgi:signal transduction histidine kinase